MNKVVFVCVFFLKANDIHPHSVYISAREVDPVWSITNLTASFCNSFNEFEVSHEISKFGLEPGFLVKSNDCSSFIDYNLTVAIVVHFKCGLEY